MTNIVSAPEPPTAMAEGTNPLIKSSPDDLDNEDASASDGIVRCPLRREEMSTAPLDPKQIKASWPLVIACLEQMSGWGVLALRLGTLALIQDCVRELSKAEADPDLVAGLRNLVDALAHMPLEA